MALIIPKHYQQRLLPETTEVAIKTIKDSFQKKLSAALHLRRVTAPLFVLAGTGVNDDLNGTEHPVAFTIDAMGGKRAEVVHSLAKWKRIKLGAYGIAPGYGIYTDMNAIRTFEHLDNMHSLYVDQWDWEKVIRESERNLDTLKDTVSNIYRAIKEIEQEVFEQFPHITPRLPKEITFVHSEDMQKQMPELTPQEREKEYAKKIRSHFRDRHWRHTRRWKATRRPRTRLRRLGDGNRRTAQGAKRRHHCVGRCARHSFRTLLNGNTRKPRIAPPPT